MNVASRFLAAELVWATGIFVVMVPMAMMDNDPQSLAHYIRWLARAIGVAAFPAGIAIATDVFGEPRRWRPLLTAIAAAAGVGLVVFALIAVVMPLVSDDARAIPRLLAAMTAPGGSWESRNDAAWDFYTTFFDPLIAVLFAAIGAQVGIWTRHSVPPPLRRVVYWMVGLGLLISGYAVHDTTYETIVLSTAADASFAAFYTVLLPASVCAGLALPTLALVRRGEIVAGAR